MQYVEHSQENGEKSTAYIPHTGVLSDVTPISRSFMKDSGCTSIHSERLLDSANMQNMNDPSILSKMYKEIQCIPGLVAGIHKIRTHTTGLQKKPAKCKSMNQLSLEHTMSHHTKNMTINTGGNTKIMITHPSMAN